MQHSKVQARTLSAYSHSFKFICRDDIPIGSSLVVGFVHLAAESLRVSSRRRLGQNLGQIRELFRNRVPAVSFLSQGQKTGKFWGSEPSEMDAETADCPLWRLFSEVNRSQRLYCSAFPQVG